MDTGGLKQQIRRRLYASHRANGERREEPGLTQQKNRMKTPLRQRWALFVLRYSRSRIWPYLCVVLTLALIILQFTKHAHVHFLLVMLPVTLMAYERLAFAELFAQQNRRIETLLNEHKL